MVLTPQKIERKSQVHPTSSDGKPYKGSWWKARVGKDGGCGHQYGSLQRKKVKEGM